jgi:hypothetical protein
MLPSDLTVASFSTYSPSAKELAVVNLDLLRRMPLALVGLLLKEVRAYDWKFPAERREIDVQFNYLHSLQEEALRRAMAGFASLNISSDISSMDWVNAPELFSQQLSAMLWSSNQIDPFRSASVQYVNAYREVFPDPPLPVPRLTMIAIGRDVKEYNAPLFRMLRPHGRHYTNVMSTGGTSLMLGAVEERRNAHSADYAHWYVDGGQPIRIPAGIACASYAVLNPLRLAVLKKVTAMGQVAHGPEGLQASLGEMRPEQFGAVANTGNPLMDYFQLSIFTEGSGTQIFSTTFVQWTTHELLRRAQPLTTFVRFAPRQTQRSMDELLADEGEIPTEDAEGALVDADMAAYYIWLYQRRLPESEKATFLVWFENHKEAVMIDPRLTPNTVSNEPITLEKMVTRVRSI